MNDSDLLANQESDSNSSHKPSNSKILTQPNSQPSEEQAGRVDSVAKRDKARGIRKLRRQRQKRSYNKISFDQLRMLKCFFSKNVYPCRADIEKLSADLGLCYIKIDNWFKHNRRLNVQKGLLKYSKKRNFTTEEVKTLNDYLDGKEGLTQSTYRKIAKQFGCNENNIKNWFSYHRRKLRGSGTDNSQQASQRDQAIFAKDESFFESEDSMNIETTVPSNEKSEKKSQASGEEPSCVKKNKKDTEASDIFSLGSSATLEGPLSDKMHESLAKYFTNVAAQTSCLLQKNNEEITNLRAIISKISQNLITVQNENLMLKNYQEVLKGYLVQQQLSLQTQMTHQPLQLNLTQAQPSLFNVQSLLLGNPQQNFLFRQQF